MRFILYCIYVSKNQNTTILVLSVHSSLGVYTWDPFHIQANFQQYQS